MYGVNGVSMKEKVKGIRKRRKKQKKTCRSKLYVFWIGKKVKENTSHRVLEPRYEIESS